MAQPVWTLSVDLQTKTAAFTSGLSDASRTARERFGEVRDAAQDMGDGVAESSGRVNYSMMEARHGVMMLGEEFGIHLPRGLTTFIASLGPVGAAMEMAFPFLAIILGATLLIEHLFKIGEAAEKAEEAGRKLRDGMETSLNAVNLKINETEIGIRKLASAPAWDLLAERLRLEDAQRGINNVTELEKHLKELLENAKATSNWNPFNWGDGSGDLQAQAKSLQEQLRGKNESDQATTLQNALTIQGNILKEMKSQTDVSAAKLSNQQKYVDFLSQEHELVQRSADSAVLGDQLKQGTDRAEKIKTEQEAQAKLYTEQQQGLDRRIKAEEAYYKKSQELTKHAAEEHTKDLELQARADEGFAAEVKKMAMEQAKLSEEAGKESARHETAMANLSAAAAEEQAKLLPGLAKEKNERIESIDEQAENARYTSQMRAYSMEIGALNTHGQDYEVKLKTLQDKEQELTIAHENKITEIKDRAEIERNQRILAGAQKFNDEISKGLTQVLMRHETFGKMIVGIGDQVVSGMMQNAVKSVMANDFTKESDAAQAARDAFKAGMKFPFPTNLVMAPALAAGAFASVMAFADGGMVPGVEKGDVVSARLTPGEGVIPKPLMDGLISAAQGGGMGANQEVHIHHSPTYHVQTIDGDGVKAMLTQHKEEFAAHIHGELRRMNK